MKWSKKRVPDNRGKPLEVWASEGYEISQNINRGADGWWFEVLFKHKYLGEHKDLAGAQRIAAKHFIDQED